MKSYHLLCCGVLACSSGASRVTQSTYSLTDLGEGRCVSVNASGVVLGVGTDNVAFTVSKGGERTPLGSISEDEISVALTIADTGLIAGYAEGVNGRRAVTYEKGQWKAVSGLGTYSAALAIDTDGALGGINDSRGFVSGKKLPLATDRSSAVYATNKGRSVGIFETQEGLTHGFVIDGGKLEDVGSLGGKNSAALAINAAGDVVGASELTSGDRRAFYKARGKELVDLGVMIRGKHADARAIDDQGRITGNVEIEDGNQIPVSFLPGTTPVSLLPEGFLHAHIAGGSTNGTVVGWGVAKGSTVHCLMWSPQ